MPGRRNRECKKVGCHALTDSADGYCEQHKKKSGQPVMSGARVHVNVAMMHSGKNTARNF